MAVKLLARQGQAHTVFPITYPKYDDWGMRIVPRMRNVASKKRFVLAMAAIIYRWTGSGYDRGNYAQTYKLLVESLTEEMQLRLSEHWVRVKLKRLGLGMSQRHPGHSYDYDGWVVTRLSQDTYKRADEGAGEIVIYSHHHPSGAAFEARLGVCGHCLSPIPASLLAFDKLVALRRKL